MFNNQGHAKELFLKYSSCLANSTTCSTQVHQYGNGEQLQPNN
jgi:hypothetical protein